MKTLAVLGSFRKGEGNTSALLDLLIEELGRKGVSCENIWLPSLRLEGCRHCDWCRENAEEGRRCVIQDSMQELYTKLEAANLIIIASPIYMAGLSAQAKVFLDRLYPYSDGGLQGKRLAAVLTSGDDVFGGMDVTVQALQRFAAYFRIEYAGTLFAAPVETRKDILRPEVLERVRNFAASLLP